MAKIVVTGASGKAVPYTPTAGDFDTLLSIQKARRLLGYEPQWSWRNHIVGS